MSQEPQIRCPVRRIEVRLHVGESLLAASDDPLFLGISGACGREFRIDPARGRSLRRGATDHFVLGSPQDAATNVKHPELNDPTSPALDLDAIEGVYLLKGNDPIPNARAVGELDDRLEIREIVVEIHSAGPTRLYTRKGPLWLGLAAGLRIELAPLTGEP